MFASSKKRPTKKPFIIAAIAVVVLAVAAVVTGLAVAHSAARSGYETAVADADQAVAAFGDAGAEGLAEIELARVLAKAAADLQKDGGHDASGLFPAEQLAPAGEVTKALAAAEQVKQPSIDSLKRPKADPSSTEEFTAAADALRAYTKTVRALTADTKELTETFSAVSTAASALYADLAEAVPDESAALLKNEPKAAAEAVTAFTAAVEQIAGVDPTKPVKATEDTSITADADQRAAYVPTIERYIAAARGLIASHDATVAAEQKAAEEAAAAQRAAEEAAAQAEADAWVDDSGDWSGDSDGSWDGGDSGGGGDSGSGAVIEGGIVPGIGGGHIIVKYDGELYSCPPGMDCGI
ncbi:hypothetical protein [Agromyces archimandritae]|uniref:Uncharacterized protein n=1 Tax=Agromyces archimandritae TaxID=2781962 RepID=A0A975FK28_9MICO|nr:hypothetical protein [Agromyces archimandritae]QTX03490.1 hypothetical protein G127AT_08960 [Agromyces archimandritae]